MAEAYFGEVQDPEEARARRLAQIEALRARQAEDSFVRNMARRGGRTLMAAGRQFGQDVVDAHGDAVGAIEGNMPPLAALRALTTPEPRAQTEATEPPWYGPTADPGAAVLAMAAGAAGPGGKAKVARTATPGRIVRATQQGGGYSVNLPSGEIPTSGLMMGKFANTDPRNVVLPAGTPLTRDAVIAHILRNPTLQRSDTFLGTWRNPETGETFLDVSRRFEPGEKRKATKYGERSGQLGGYDIDAKVAGLDPNFPVGNWEKFVQGPEFGGRLRELAAEGDAYMAQFPGREWWGNPNLERVYGKARMPQVSGFTASTAPNQLLRPNVQQMTEYMRRHIKGEPTIQPEWRAGEGEMTWKPGSQIGMEDARVANLEKSAAGRLDLLSADKVREEAAAMMGDPNASPLDRYWARVAEDPAQGVYTATKEGVVEPGKQYATLKSVINQSAIEHGRPLRQHSAVIWTAIRERIRKFGELYGQKFRGGAAGESKSYDDHFMDLVREKAQHLGITVAEMEKRLGAGDATLLSFVAASPVLAPVIADVLAEQGAAQ